MTRTAFAKALGIGRVRLYQLIARGMPTTNLEAAQEWRLFYTSRRLPTNGPNAGRFPTAPLVKRKKRRNNARLERTGDSLLDLLESARFAQRQAFRLFTEASADNDIAGLTLFMAIHSKATINCLKAETMYREEME